MPIGEACLVSNSDITCLHPPQGAIGVSLILDIDPATMTKHTIFESGYFELA